MIEDGRIETANLPGLELFDRLTGRAVFKNDYNVSPVENQDELSVVRLLRSPSDIPWS